MIKSLRTFRTLRTFKNLEIMLRISGKDFFIFPLEFLFSRLSLSSFTEQGILHHLSHIKEKEMLI